MTVGLSFSGGGITGLLASTCVLNSLNTQFDTFSTNDLAFSTTSGGTIGYGIFTNAGPPGTDAMYFPEYDTSMSYDDANTELTGGKDYWFANANSYLEFTASPKPTAKHRDVALTLGANETETAGTSAAMHKAHSRMVGLGSALPSTSGWWRLAIDTCFYLGYGIHDYDITPGTRDWYVNMGLLKQNGCPISLDSDGVYEDASGKLWLAVMDMVPGTIANPQGYAVTDDVSTLDAMSYSSAFWVASIVESSAQYLLLSNTLMSASAKKDGTEKDFYWTDGGFVDTTGVVAHLQQQTSSIVTFYNNNDDLTELSAPWSFLFGVMGGGTDTMNHIEGPTLGQVFADSSLWDDVYTNLTDGSILRATLSNVEILENSYLGTTAYTLDSLVIISNQYSDEFIDSFTDSQIKSKLDANFPNKFDVALPTLDANVLCMMQDYKVQTYADELKTALGL
mmetsp:Transcript_48421/g.135842  ORF Transcript_48421/g.135842 Transcript_48421/m.135842 type:complete len:451 (+) Transcript_48421:237-1589(+)